MKKLIAKKELFLLPDLGINPHSIKDFFTKEMFEEVKKQVYNVGLGTPEKQYHPMMGRWESGINLSFDIEEYVLHKIREIFNDNTILKAYHFTVRYQVQNGCVPNLWEHLDQNGSQISINIAIENTANWPLIVEGKVYKQDINEAVIFCGQQHMHARPPYPSADENVWTTQLFLHYSRPDHWIQDRSIKNGIHLYGSDGDVRFFNRNRYLPLPDPPVSQEICKCHDYSGVMKYYDYITGEYYEEDPEIEPAEIINKEIIAPGIVVYKTSKKSSRIIKGLVQNAMFKQWHKAQFEQKVPDDAFCYDYILTDEQSYCHPQDPIRRARESLELIMNNATSNYISQYQVKPVASTYTLLLRYEPGNRMHIHTDSSAENQRVISTCMYLNDDYVGGEINFPYFNKTIKPESGDVIVFCSEFPYTHEVKKVLCGTKYAAVKWYNYT